MTPARTLGIKLATAGAVALGMLLQAGCGDDTGLPKRYEVRGTVKYNDKPVEKGRIDFIPDKGDGRAAGGDITNGAYFLTTAVNGDGAIPGTYKVTVTAIEVDTSKGASSGGAGQQFRQSKAYVEVAKAAKQLVPKKYGSAQTTDLGAEVKAQSNVVDFNLKD